MEKAKAPALAKGLEIIDLVRLHGSLSFVQIQDQLQDNPGSLNRYLHTLLAADYLYRNSAMKYELGIKLMDLSDNKSIWPKLRSLYTPILVEINQKFDVTTLLLAHANDHITAIEKMLAPDNLGMMQKNHQFNDSLWTIWSSVYYDKQQFLNHLESLDCLNLPSNAEIKSKSEANRLHESILEKGYMSFRNVEKQIQRFGFPISYCGQVVALIGVGTFVQHLSDDQINELIMFIQTRMIGV